MSAPKQMTFWVVRRTSDGEFWWARPHGLGWTNTPWGAEQWDSRIKAHQARWGLDVPDYRTRVVKVTRTRRSA